MSASHAQLLRTLVEHTVRQLSAHSASAMAHNPRKRTWQLVFWAVASRRGDDRSSTASKRGAKITKNSIAPHVEFSCSDRFSEFLRKWNYAAIQLLKYLTWSRHIFRSFFLLAYFQITVSIYSYFRQIRPVVADLCTTSQIIPPTT
jgi:hypothetical protein